MEIKQSPALVSAFGEAVMLASSLRQEFVGVEHLFWGLLQQSEATRALRACGAKVTELKTEVKEFIDQDIPSVPEDIGLSEEPMISVGCQELLMISAQHAVSSGNAEITCVNILIALFHLEDSFTLALLESQGVDRFGLIQYHTDHHARSGGEGDDDDERSSRDDDDDDDDQDEEEGRFRLSDYVTNLNERAREGKIDPMIGRVEELDRLIHVLARRRKNNPLLIGEAGVGKTAIAEGLALAIADGQVPDLLKSSVVYSLDVSSIVAGTRYRGDFEERIKKILKKLRSDPDAIVFIDELHTFIGAGAVNGGALDASSIFKPMLARGELRCIGATTWKEYRTVIMKDQAFARRFQNIEIGEPTQEEAVEILRGLKSSYEEFHQVRYTDEAIKEAVSLSSRYFHDRFLPDKAIDVIDEAGAEVRLKSGGEVGKTIIESTIARMASVPSQEVSEDDREQLKRLEPALKGVVFGQDEAVDQLVSAIKLSRAGLGVPDQPIGAFMFTGPTGVGKTEVAKQLAKTLSLELIRFDMSEYMERHTVSRLIGAPPGYVGFDQGGLLTDAVSKKPHSVVLLDEIEKAHPEVFNILLQVMDHGTLTDNNGRKADFRNVILIMTSNVGAQDTQRNRPGFFAESTSRLGDEDEAFKRTFSPEFRNRLHARVRFAPLSPEVCTRVAEKQCLELIQQLSLRKVELRFSPPAVKVLADLGYDPLNGARPMQRVLRERIKRLLADDLLFGKLADGGSVLIEASDVWQTYLQEREDALAEGGSAPRQIKRPKEESFVVHYLSDATGAPAWDEALKIEFNHEVEVSSSQDTLTDQGDELHDQESSPEKGVEVAEDVSDESLDEQMSEIDSEASSSDQGSKDQSSDKKNTKKG